MAVYVAMACWTLPAIATDAAELAPFDLRFRGYSAAEARAFLAMLGDDGRELYLGPQRWLDLAYPALLAAVLIGALRALVRPRWLYVVLSLVAVAGMLADYIENLRVAALLTAVGAVSDAMIAAASHATQAKALLTSVVLLAVAAGLARAIWIKWRAR